MNDESGREGVVNYSVVKQEWAPGRLSSPVPDQLMSLVGHKSVESHQTDGFIG